MRLNNKHLVVGLGEIGRPIHRILVERYGETDVFGYDPKDGQTVLPIPPIKALHVCIPWLAPLLKEGDAAS